MAQDGGPVETVLTCAQDGVATRLRCSDCATPICTKCFVRTQVGLKCPACGAASGPPRPPVADPRSPVPVAVAVTVAVLLVVAGGVWAATRPGAGPSTEAVGGPGPTVAGMLLGSGQLPDGIAWTLEGRREGNLCSTLTLTPGPPSQERCEAPPGDKAVAGTVTRPVRGLAGTVYVTLGLVSPGTERVRVAPEGEAAWEVLALGSGRELGGRFFVAAMTNNVPVVFTALAGDGRELGRQNRPSLPPPP